MSFSQKIKIFTLLAAFLALLFSLFPKKPQCARASALSYALIGDDAVLYSDEGKTAVTTLPATYFAVVLNKAENGYVSVSYLDLAGKVEENKLTVVDYEPRYKYADGSLKLNNDGHNVRVRSAPDHENGEVVGDLSDGETLSYYGTVAGSAQVAALGNEWFFVRFTDGGKTKHGYVYSLYVTANPIPENVIEPLPAQDPEPEPSVEPENNDGRQTDEFSLSKNGEAIAIVALCLPVIVVTYLLFRKPKKSSDETER